MATTRCCPSCLSRSFQQLSLARASATLPPTFLLPFQQQIRTAVSGTSENAAKYKRKAQTRSNVKKKSRTSYMSRDLSQAKQFPLLDAMRYLRAAEVGRPANSSKYELHVRFRTAKNGAVIRSAVRLPHPVKTDLRVAVIAAPDSPAARAATAAGAAIVGEDTVFEAFKNGDVSYDRCLCHTDSLPRLQKANLGRILGPRGLMPSTKSGTVTNDVKGALLNMLGSTQYRERMGVVRVAVGQLGFTPEMLQANVKAFVERVKSDAATVSDRTPKELAEVVLSSTNGPGFSLNGEFKGENSLPVRDLVAV